MCVQEREKEGSGERKGVQERERSVSGSTTTRGGHLLAEMESLSGDGSGMLGTVTPLSKEGGEGYLCKTPGQRAILAIFPSSNPCNYVLLLSLKVSHQKHVS